MSNVFTSSRNETILLPFCTSCNTMMNEIGFEDDTDNITYHCPYCGEATEEPFYIDTAIKDDFNNTIDELVEVKTQLFEFHLREVKLKEKLLKKMKILRRRVQNGARIEYRNYTHQKMAICDIRDYIKAKRGEEFWDEIIAHCAHEVQYEHIAVTLDKTTKENCKRRARLQSQ